MFSYCRMCSLIIECDPCLQDRDEDTCLKCGRSLDGGRFCPGCGTAHTVTSARSFASRKGAMLGCDMGNWT